MQPTTLDGEYFVLQFATAFAHKAAGVETVSLALEEGEWRVVGYFVR